MINSRSPHHPHLQHSGHPPAPTSFHSPHPNPMPSSCSISVMSPFLPCSGWAQHRKRSFSTGLCGRAFIPRWPAWRLSLLWGIGQEPSLDVFLSGLGSRPVRFITACFTMLLISCFTSLLISCPTLLAICCFTLRVFSLSRKTCLVHPSSCSVCPSCYPHQPQFAMFHSNLNPIVTSFIF